jgi:predicted DCC family thiol-disulfide oxidoreductase YuxK
MKFKEVTQLKNLIFYDGDCGFCNTSVQLVLKHRKTDFYFIALQTDLAKRILSNHDVTIEMNTLYLIQEGQLFDKSTAAIRIAKHLKGLYPILYFIGIVVPSFIRDWMYNQIAKRRHKIRPGYCAMPSPEERLYFIDKVED